MLSQKLKFALFGNEYQARKSTSVQKLLKVLQHHEAEIYIDRPFYNLINREHLANVRPTGVFDGYNFDVDFVISMGGDGTFLKAASRVESKEVPIMGINMGRLGFLANVSPDEIERSINALYSGEYTAEEHAVIKLETEKGNIGVSPYALNDIALLKRDNASMISISTCINGEHLVTYQADGLIISTPTGSTAYSLSNGGPIIVPQTGVMCLTPVAPHSLNLRPIVIPDNSLITITIESRSHNFLVAIDGRSEKVNEKTKLTIRKAKHSVKIIKRRGKDFFNTLHDKMMWGIDTR